MRVPRRYLPFALVGAVAVSALVAWQAQAETTTGIDWSTCADAADVDCASIEVPLDWANPDGETIDIGLSRRRATDPDARIGSILMDPGGPGGSGVDLVKSGEVFTSAVNARFDTIGLDPRGVANSTPVRCDAELAGRAIAAAMPASAKEYDDMVAINTEVSQDCRERTGPLYDHVDNLSVVRDIEAIRVALGEGDLNYVGYSYGTLMGQQYAQQYPDNIRTMVLDGNMDHSMTSTWESMRSQTAAAEEIFVDFADWCDEAAECALYGMDTRRVYGELRDKAKAGELTNPQTGDAVDFATFSGLVPGSARPTRWGGLADTLKALYDGKGEKVSALKAAAAPIALPDQAIWCQDWDLPIGGYQEWKQLTTKLAKKFPNTQWTGNITGSAQCEGYTGETTNPQARLDIDGDPSMVMLGNLHDPATVYSWTRNAAKQSGATLVTYEGYGHTIYAYGRTSGCVNNAIDGYLIDKVEPADGLRCPSVDSPGTESAATIGDDSPADGLRYFN